MLMPDGTAATARQDGCGSTKGKGNETMQTFSLLHRSAQRSVQCGRDHTAIRRRRWGRATLAACLLLTGAAGADEQMKPETLERLKHATVYVKTSISERERGDRPLGTGSGFFINATGLLISNNHVVDPTHGKSPEEKQNFHYRGGKLTWQVVTDSGVEGEQKTYDATVLYQNEAADQALLQAFAEGDEKLPSPNFMRLLPESRLEKAMKVWAFGFPGGDTQARRGDSPAVQVETGNVLTFPRTPGGRIRKVYTDVIARPGNSGGPMVNQEGMVVGTVTLMEPPEGREDTGGARYSALVPAKLASEMVRNAFKLKKIPEGTDFTPFMESLTGQGGLLNVPGYDRLADQEVLFYDNGDRIYGNVATESVTWDCELGSLSVPAAGIAYIMVDADGANLFLEGGNRLSASKLEGKFPFVPDGGEKIDIPFKDVRVVSFRRSNRQLGPVQGKMIEFDSDLCHLVLSDTQGEIQLAGRTGTVGVALEDIERVGADANGQQVVTLTDGRRMTGTFRPPPVNVVIAATGSTIPLDMTKIRRASIDVRRFTGHSDGGLSLEGIYRDAHRELRRIAQILESDEPGSASSKIEPWLEPGRFKKLPNIEKDQVRMLDAVAKLRSGDQAGAEKALRQASKSEDENINAFATAALELFKQYPQFRYKDRPLSDRAAFLQAGAAMAEEYMAQTRDMLKDALLLQGEKRGEFLKAVSDVKKHEKLMTVAAVFVGPDAEDLLVRVWKVAMDAALRELQLVQTEDAEMHDRRGSSGRSGQGAQLAQQRSLDDLQERKRTAEEAFRTYIFKRWDYGFRIEDPDIEEMRAKGAESDSNDGP